MSKKTKKRVFIIAEAGVNHNGSLKTAKELVDSAFEARADAVKFQTFKAEKIVTDYADKAGYQTKTTDKKESQLDMLKKLELSYEEQIELCNYCREKGIEFLSSPFDNESIDFLLSLELNYLKIPSAEITNYFYLKKIGESGKKIILSTGMSFLGEIEAALNLLYKSGSKKEDIYLLHCNSQYPTPFEDVNLSAMNTIKSAFGSKIGYSDHTEGITVPVAAVAMGAEVIEKHFTLNKDLAGPDHKASLAPDELKKMVASIREVEKSIGSPFKSPSESEIQNRESLRKNIVAAREIKKGDFFSRENLTAKRTGSKGISPMNLPDIIDKKADKDYSKDELILLF